MTTMLLMPRKPKPKSDQSGTEPQKGDRHKPSLQVRIPMVFKDGLQKLAALHGDDIPDRVKQAVREYLQKHNLWPKTLDELPRTDDE